MKPITDSPEWNRFFWAVMLLVLAVIVFSCEQEQAYSPTLRRIDDAIAHYWFVLLILSIGFGILYRFRKNGFFLFLTIVLFIAWTTPYIFMFGVWGILQLF